MVLARRLIVHEQLTSHHIHEDVSFRRNFKRGVPARFKVYRRHEDVEERTNGRDRVIPFARDEVHGCVLADCDCWNLLSLKTHIGWCSHLQARRQVDPELQDFDWATRSLELFR
jgi:hypothetical protein